MSPCGERKYQAVEREVVRGLFRPGYNAILATAERVLS